MNKELKLGTYDKDGDFIIMINKDGYVCKQRSGNTNMIIFKSYQKENKITNVEN